MEKGFTDEETYTSDPLIKKIKKKQGSTRTEIKLEDQESHMLIKLLNFFLVLLALNI
jgi:hypothetical protein